MKRLLLTVGFLVTLTACASQDEAHSVATERGFTVLSTKHAPIDAAQANVTFGTCPGELIYGSTGNVSLYVTFMGVRTRVDDSLAYVGKLREIDAFKSCFQDDPAASKPSS